MKIECPYCNARLSIIYSERIDYPSRDEVHEKDCTACGETFFFEIKLNVTIEARRKDICGAV